MGQVDTLSVLFQSTLPRRERHNALTLCKSNSTNFNPRSREGSDNCNQGFFPCLQISIHAPAKGATAVPVLVSASVAISIHAPAKGATQMLADMQSLNQNFNPRSREGSDLTLTLSILNTLIFQSTLPRRERQQSYLILYLTFFNFH